MRALILCGGRGTRLGLKKTPKCMVKINKKPILEHIVNHLNKYGITEIIVNIHQHYDKIFKYFGTRLLYLYEPIPLGEMGTERLLQNWLGDEYIVMNGDTLTNVDLKILKEFEPEVQEVRFIGNSGRYGGTKIIRSNKKGVFSSIDCSHKDWYYFDCGTPKKLVKARKYFKCKKT